jgi:hypothetical protein
MPSLQETFDTVVAHLRRQGAKAQIPGSRSGEMTFVFRAPDGKHCAAGALIPDELYDPALECTAVGGTDEDQHKNSNAVTLLIEELGHDIELVKALQAVHDNAALAEWESKLEQVSAEFGLRHSPPAENPNSETGDVQQ